MLYFLSCINRPSIQKEQGSIVSRLRRGVGFAYTLFQVPWSDLTRQVFRNCPTLLVLTKTLNSLRGGGKLINYEKFI